MELAAVEISLQQGVNQLLTLNTAFADKFRTDNNRFEMFAIARAMAMAPRLILADEPTGNLDSRSGEEVITLLEGLNREQGMTLVVVTHDPRLGERAGRRLSMDDGRISSDSGGG